MCFLTTSFFNEWDFIVHFLLSSYFQVISLICLDKLLPTVMSIIQLTPVSQKSTTTMGPPHMWILNHRVDAGTTQLWTIWVNWTAVNWKKSHKNTKVDPCNLNLCCSGVNCNRFLLINVVFHSRKQSTILKMCIYRSFSVTLGIWLT